MVNKFPVMFNMNMKTWGSVWEARGKFVEGIIMCCVVLVRMKMNGCLCYEPILKVHTFSSIHDSQKVPKPITWTNQKTRSGELSVPPGCFNISPIYSKFQFLLLTDTNQLLLILASLFPSHTLLGKTLQ